MWETELFTQPGKFISPAGKHVYLIHSISIFKMFFFPLVVPNCSHVVGVELSWFYTHPPAAALSPPTTPCIENLHQVSCRSTRQWLVHIIRYTQGVSSLLFPVHLSHWRFLCKCCFFYYLLKQGSQAIVEVAALLNSVSVLGSRRLSSNDK